MKIILSKEAFEQLEQKLNEPPKYLPKLAELMKLSK